MNGGCRECAKGASRSPLGLCVAASLFRRSITLDTPENGVSPVVVNSSFVPVGKPRRIFIAGSARGTR